MSEVSAVALLGDDLMMRSRLESALEPSGIALGASRDLAMLPETDLVFVDLNYQVEERLAAIAELRSRKPELTICGFCSHSEKDARRRAMAAGANHVVTNESVPKAALRLVDAADVAAVNLDDE